MLSMLPKLDENSFCNRYILAPKSIGQWWSGIGIDYYCLMVFLVTAHCFPLCGHIHLFV